jgi:hypothetical protein
VLTALYNVQKLLFLTVETDRKRTILVRYTDMASRGVIDPVISCGSNANVVPHHYKVTMVTYRYAMVTACEYHSIQDGAIENVYVNIEMVPYRIEMVPE